ncbi:2'-5' RNA ligase family protein [Clostridium frigidicarnis]|uniref:2'-5' RNA ligase n=1 Tax=Clostridium frigidicarnis TaxID=84698 RepID=A0A1I0XRV6_9CLOT|nr:2'-5' RNA ligase family protein [Clostridium frigidicarnis]SFB03010.1 2'-5' RNA ligase [Clostridium frigidicarnis]
MKRSIILFPSFYNINTIKSIREKYDPLANCIAPHITIVFPFDSDISTDELKWHFNEVLKGIKKFSIQLKDFTGDFRDGYLFLNIKKGNDHIIELHDKLYSGILDGFLYRKATYCPHLTVGRLNEQIEFDKAVDELSYYSESFETVIDKIYVENIDINENSIIEFSFDL